MRKKSFIRRSATKFSDLFLPKSPKNIIGINYAVTYLCNSRCLMCNIWKNYKQNPALLREELSFNQVKKTFNQSNFFKNPRWISFTGGEAFLKKDFPDIYGFFLKKYPEATFLISSNGINSQLTINGVKKILNKFNPPSLRLSFSLDGPKEIHDRVRNVRGAYKNLLQTIDCLKKLGRKIEISLSYTILPDNYKYVLETYELAKKLNLHFSCRLASFSENYFGNINNKFNWTKKQFLEVEYILKKIADDKITLNSLSKKIFDPSSYFLERMVNYHENPRRMFNCNISGAQSLYLDPYGNIFPCIMRIDCLGNIKKDALDKIWLSKVAERIRKSIKQKQCHCWIDCETIPSLDRDPKIVIKNLLNFLRES